MQVEGLCALVEGVQELVARAEQVTSAEFVRAQLCSSVLAKRLVTAPCMHARLQGCRLGCHACPWHAESRVHAA